MQATRSSPHLVRRPTGCWLQEGHVEAKKFNDYAYIVDVDGVRLDECIAMRDFRVQNNAFTGEDGGTSESRKRTVGEIVIA